MCGNGGRCLVAFAKFLGIIKDRTTFEAIDGIHEATIEGDLVKLKMNDVQNVKVFENHQFLDTGSPHHVQLETNLDLLDVKGEGAKIRYGEPYGKSGANINFVKKVNENTFKVRTYERGVEDETLSCGTGVTAVAIAMYNKGEAKNSSVNLETPGGMLTVTFSKVGDKYTNVWLIGKATQVFKGTFE